MTFEDASTSDADPLLGRLIAGNFRVIRLIGSGAMGNVYQCEQLSLGKYVAVKVLHAHLMGDDKLVRRFQREAKSASRLNHPNSIQIIDSGRDPGGMLYIAMELLTGRDLAQVIRDDFPLPLPRVIRVMSQVLSALDEAHAHGVIHRDLKPSNIMLIERRGETDFVKVCDYGIAKSQVPERDAVDHLDGLGYGDGDGDGEPQMLTIQGLVCGTPEYMSPEQARGEPLDGRTDLYSAAVILFQMVTGDIPFHGNTPIAIVSRHLSEVPVVPSSRHPRQDLPPELDDLILRGLAKSRELRPASAAQFREELERIGLPRRPIKQRATAPTLPASRVAGLGSNDEAVRNGERSGTTAELSGPLLTRFRTGSARAVAVGIVLSATLASAAMVALRAVRKRASDTATAPGLLATALPSTSTTTPPPTREGSVSERAPTRPPEVGVGAAPKVPAPSSPTSEPSGSLVSRRERPSPTGNRHLGGAANRPGRATAPEERSAGLAAPSREDDVTHAVALADAEAALARGDQLGARSAKDQIADAEKLLSQGEVGQACQRGEELKLASPRLAGIYKFLGKCYMRSGNSSLARDNYRRYLELAPGAPDAVFIESIVK